MNKGICGFPSRISLEAFPRGFPTGLSHVPPWCDSILGLKVDAVQGKQVSLEWTETSRGAPCPLPSSRGGILSLRGRSFIPSIPVAFQEEALSTENARGTPGSCYHSQSHPDVSVHSRETCFPCTASTFKPRIDSHHCGMWDRPVGKPRGKASRESHRSLDTREGKRDTAAAARGESAGACPHTR